MNELKQAGVVALEQLLVGMTDKGLRLEYNDYKCGYCNLEEELVHNRRFYVQAKWTDATQQEKAIASDTLWELMLDRKDEKNCKKIMAAAGESLIAEYANAELLAGMEHIKELLGVLLTGKYSSAHLSYNDHLDNYADLKEAIESKDDWLCNPEDWVSEEELKNALEKNTIWTFQWYPNTPVGFSVIHASSLLEIMKYFEEEEE